MIIITVTKDNQPVDHFLFWKFQFEKAYRKMAELCRTCCGVEITKNELATDRLIISDGSENPSTVSYIEKADNDNS